MTDSTIVVCPHCHVANRVPSARLASADSGGVCGRCKQRLHTGKPLVLNHESYDRHIQRSEIPVVVDFWAPWCGPCRMMSPAFDQAAEMLGPSVQLAKLNTEEEQAIASRLGIRSIPTLAIFRNGVEIARQSGAIDAGNLARWIQDHLR